MHDTFYAVLTQVQKNTVISAGSDGLVMVHEIRAGSLVRVFVSEDIKLSSGSGVVQRRAIRSLTVSGHTVVYGDDAPNIKLLDWKKGWFLLIKVFAGIPNF